MRPARVGDGEYMNLLFIPNVAQGDSKTDVAAYYYVQQLSKNYHYYINMN